MSSAAFDLAIYVTMVIGIIFIILIMGRAGHNNDRHLERELYEAQAAIQFAILLADQPGLEFLRSWQRDDDEELHAAYPRWSEFRARYVRLQFKLNA